MSLRYPQVKNLRSVDAFRLRCDELGIELPIDDEVDASGALAQPVEIPGIATAPNRFAILPMEGWDAEANGTPTDLVRRRWQRFGTSEAGLVWAEATAVRHDGRANPNQLVLDETTVGGFGELRELTDPAQVVGLQLTHSGRWSRPDGQPRPRTAYEHPLLDQRVGAGHTEVLGDEELDELVGCYVEAAVLAAQAGFGFVDVKHCHGYLLHELLSGVDRPGRYGGPLERRMQFLRAVVAGIRQRVPGLGLAVRLSAFDLMPFVPGDERVGRPETTGDYPYAFGGDGNGVAIDLTETHAFLDELVELGIGLVSVTAGSPYYNPHVQRPAFFPPSDGYRPPEDPLVGVARQVAVTAELAQAHPEIVMIGSAYSYLQDWLAHVGQAVVGSGGAAMVGLGRMALSYPDLPADVLAGEGLRRGDVCRTFSDCTTAPRNGLISGCFPLDPFYKEHPQRVELAAIKRRAAG